MTSGVQGSSARLDEDRSANTELERVRSAATYLSSRSRRRIDSRPYTHTVSRPHDPGHAGFPSDREGGALDDRQQGQLGGQRQQGG